MSAFTELLGNQLLTKDGSLKPTADLLQGKVAVALYFSGNWCPPCRGFTPILAEQYEKIYKAKGMEVIFVSSDEDEKKFLAYYGEHPWLALPFADRKLKEELSKKYGVQSIPTLIILDPKGEIITKDGRSKINEPDSFPWITKS
eukprot:GEMP01103673.1.p1 GENE.GEMP01103673.1~~GEMP01103673.1.p1  ORF type:complete len:144 (+),score=31.58 GEMP01103673.1:122-553(+)